MGCVGISLLSCGALKGGKERREGDSSGRAHTPGGGGKEGRRGGGRGGGERGRERNGLC